MYYEIDGQNPSVSEVFTGKRNVPMGILLQQNLVTFNFVK